MSIILTSHERVCFVNYQWAMVKNASSLQKWLIDMLVNWYVWTTVNYQLSIPPSSTIDNHCPKYAQWLTVISHGALHKLKHKPSLVTIFFYFGKFLKLLHFGNGDFWSINYWIVGWGRSEVIRVVFVGITLGTNQLHICLKLGIRFCEIDRE